MATYCTAADSHAGFIVYRHRLNISVIDISLIPAEVSEQRRYVGQRLLGYLVGEQTGKQQLVMIIKNRWVSPGIEHQNAHHGLYHGLCNRSASLLTPAADVRHEQQVSTVLQRTARHFLESKCKIIPLVGTMPCVKCIVKRFTISQAYVSVGTHQDRC